MKKLYKTTIVIWSNTNPEECDIEDIARETLCGDHFLAEHKIELVGDPTEDVDWNAGSEDFFKGNDDEQEEY